MKHFLFFISLPFFCITLFAQNIPVLTGNEILPFDSIGKKAGWAKIELDSNFREITGQSIGIYSIYKFLNSNGKDVVMYWNLMPKKYSKAVYRKDDSISKSTLINGTLLVYDENNNQMLKYIFREGFQIRQYDYRWGIFGNKFPGKLFSVIEYSYKTNSVRMNANNFNKDGEIIRARHLRMDGYTIQDLPFEFITDLEP